MPNAYVLLSHERSGSHFVGEFLATLAGIRMFDEVCNPDAVKPTKARESFFRFRYDAILKDSRLLLEPTIQGHRDFITAYFAHLQSLAAPARVAVDIKYGHVQNFEWWWWPMFERPALLTLCEAADIGIIHLYRENVVEATVSSMVANRRKIWHSWQPGALAESVAPLALPVGEVVRKSKLLERQTRLFRDWTRKNTKIEITYESIATDLGKGGPAEVALTGFLESSPKKVFSPRVQKLTPPLREIVENFGELKEACEKAGWERFVS